MVQKPCAKKPCAKKPGAKKPGAKKPGAVKQGSAGRTHAESTNPCCASFFSACSARRSASLWELAWDIGAINLPLKLRMANRADWLLTLLTAAHLTWVRTGGHSGGVVLAPRGGPRCRCW